MGFLKKLFKNSEQKKEILNKLVFQDSGILTNFVESKDNYFLAVGKEMGGKDSVALIKDNKMLWKNKFDNIVHFALSTDNSYCVIVTQLQKKEMPTGYRSGGHIYLINKEGKIKDIKIPCDGLSCSISPDCKNLGVITMGPEWGVYYFDNKGKILWKKRFDSRIGGIEILKDYIQIYDKMHKETRKEIMRLNNNGEIEK
ncbi:MAG: hypothetical protein PHO02_00705 [Candidatus Nanoarchaeia archaeon]|nr:hypothetical protein [Candidatus Nanoarchaeia archaeon]